MSFHPSDSDGNRTRVTAVKGRCLRHHRLGRQGPHSGHRYRRGADDRPRHQGSPREVIVFQRALQGLLHGMCGSPFFIFRQLFYPNQPCRIVLSIQIARRMVVFWLTNFKKNGTIEKSSIGGRPFIQAPGKLTDQRDGPKTKGMVTILPWARTN